MTRDDVPGLLLWGKHPDPRLEHYSFTDFDLPDVEAWYLSKQKLLTRKLFGLFSEKTPIGFITLKKINFLAGTAEIGLAVNPDRMGQGYGTQMLRSMLDYVFENYPLDTVFLEVAAFNRVAGRLYEKCGFMYVSAEWKAYEHQLNKNLVIDFPDDFILKDGRIQAEFLRMSYRRNTICSVAPAKINLGLRVGARNPDGYHDLVTTMQSLDLRDLVYLRLTPSSSNSASPEIHIRSVHPGIEEAHNLAYIAAQRFFARFPDTMPRHFALDISIYKKIPQGAGLGGGSADAAAVIRGLDRLFFGEESGRNLVLGEELLELAAEIGSDVPFCLRGGTAVATGRGERLEHYKPKASLPLLLLPSPFGVSTVKAFRTLDRLRDLEGVTPSQSGVEEAYALKRVYESSFLFTEEERRELAAAIPGNDLERAADLVLFEENTEKNTEERAESVSASSSLNTSSLDTSSCDRSYIESRKNALLMAGALFTSMTGSGSCVYGIFESEAAATKAARMLNGAILCFTSDERNP